MGLIVLGGIGFVVHPRGLLPPQGDRKPGCPCTRRIVLITTGMSHPFRGGPLLCSSRSNTLSRGSPAADADPGLALSSPLPRGRRDSTPSTSASSPMPRSCIMIVLMFIGGSPGSTGGGIKTTSFTLLLLMIWNRWKGSEEVTISNRTDPEGTDRPDHVHHLCARAFSVFLIVVGAAHGGGARRICGPSRAPAVRGIPVRDVSAFGTVGLSMGVTPKLTDIQKLADRPA